MSNPAATMRLQAVARNIIKLNWTNQPNFAAEAAYTIALRAGEWLARLEERKIWHSHIKQFVPHIPKMDKLSIKAWADIGKLLFPGVDWETTTKSDLIDKDLYETWKKLFGNKKKKKINNDANT